MGPPPTARLRYNPPSMADLELDVNGRRQILRTDPDRTLLQVLREDLDLTATKYGCGEGQCGACTVLVDGRPERSCLLRLDRVERKKIVTLEGLAPEGKLHPVQQAFLDAGAMQCGFCTAGMILSAAALLEQKPKPTDGEIASALDGNLCRCCCYPRMVDAVRRAAGGGK
jgi:aerobic-type carbon monoxide dehydrogenase small subunit (CoxS/CutS family)